jgi:aminoglycoside phosphotransferase (APT) family kinase protein
VFRGRPSKESAIHVHSPNRLHPPEGSRHPLGPAQLTPFSRTGWTNRTELLTTDDGGRFVFRRYRWPFDSEDMQRVEKEPWLHKELARRGVPVPRILAAVQEGGDEAALLEYLDGIILGDAGDEATSAWYETGKPCALYTIFRLKILNWIGRRASS